MDEPQKEEKEEKDEGDMSEARKPKTKRNPAMPSKAEIEEHNITHLPRRGWCKHCVAGGAVADPHRAAADEEKTIPTIHLDYYFMGIKEEEQDGVAPYLAVKDDASHTTFSHALEAKGVNEYAVKVLKADVEAVGHKKILFKSDNEPAIVALKQEVKNLLKDTEILMEESPVGDHQSNGYIERAIQELEKQIRIIKSSIDCQYGTSFETQHPIVTWANAYAGQLLTRFHVMKDGRTAYELNKGKGYKKALCPFGECVQFQIARSIQNPSNMDLDWKDGVYVGLRERSNEFVVLTPAGACRAGCIRRRPDPFKWDLEFAKKVKGFPWEPTPGHGKKKMLQGPMVILPAVPEAADKRAGGGSAAVRAKAHLHQER